MTDAAALLADHDRWTEGVARRAADLELTAAVERLSIALKPVLTVDSEGFSEPWSWDAYLAHFALRRTVGLPDMQPARRP